MALDTLPFLGPLWRYRSFIGGMVQAEFRQRYTGALLGPFWAVLTPALLIATYLAVFSQVMRGRLPGLAEGDGLDFGLFLAIGIICWTLFQETVMRCQSMFLDHAGLLRKSTFPRASLPVAILLSAMLGFALILLVFLALILALGRFPGVGLLGLIPLLALQQALAAGLGVLLGIATVFLRDLAQLTPTALTLGFWLTPIVYPRSILPDWAAGLIAWNPLADIFEGYQALVLNGRYEGWAGLWPQLLLAALLLLGAVALFRRLAPAIVDEL